MREPIRDSERLHHILNACNLLINRQAQDSIQDLKNDPIKFYGYVKLIEIIGEATYKITKDLKNSHAEIPWSVMESMRHVLVHDYYRISHEKLWNTIVYDLPALKPMVEKVISELQK